MQQLTLCRAVICTDVARWSVESRSQLTFHELHPLQHEWPPEAVCRFPIAVIGYPGHDELETNKKSIVLNTFPYCGTELKNIGIGCTAFKSNLISYKWASGTNWALFIAHFLRNSLRNGNSWYSPWLWYKLSHDSLMHYSDWHYSTYLRADDITALCRGCENVFRQILRDLGAFTTVDVKVSVNWSINLIGCTVYIPSSLTRDNDNLIIFH
jgi:hypothetical protein